METNTGKIARARPRPEIGYEDRLSSLPDQIISHILSFMETKYAVGTAVLSRRDDEFETDGDIDDDDSDNINDEIDSEDDASDSEEDSL
ncbi:unnamed protein product [Linum tenue]|uniref:F-box domain-containing protein n=1 Tax=Linum tenue TaxID=586396 RepID=A0AAV0GQ51_9ROSI|nr:unnamed protein product [Linum tenue]